MKTKNKFKIGGRLDVIVAAAAIVLVIILWITTIQEGRHILNQDGSERNEPVPYGNGENGDSR